MTALSDELKPCPFCGGAAAVSPRTCDKDTPYNPADRAFPVTRCGQCGAEAVGKDWGRPETAAAAWNRRALLAAQPAVQQPAEDDVFAALDLSPDTFRTEGGAVNVGKLRAAIRHPLDYLPADHWLCADAAIKAQGGKQ